MAEREDVKENFHTHVHSRANCVHSVFWSDILQQYPLTDGEKYEGYL